MVRTLGWSGILLVKKERSFSKQFVRREEQRGWPAERGGGLLLRRVNPSGKASS